LSTNLVGQTEFPTAPYYEFIPLLAYEPRYESSPWREAH
jgi:hypothetical protein